MKLSRLYSNVHETFVPIDFVSGLNVVMADIRQPETRNLDSHNLGKSTLGLLLNFCFLSGVDKNFFLLRHGVFQEFVFYLEIELDSGGFLTVRRALSQPSKISFNVHGERGQDFSDLSEDEWLHWNVPFEKAKGILESRLNLTALGEFGFRKSTGYLLRGQNDYADVFRLSRDKGGDRDWKPFVAHILGFDSGLVSKIYSKEADLESVSSQEKLVETDLGGSIDDASKIEGLLHIKQQEVKRRQSTLDRFDFASRDRATISEVVDSLDTKIAERNEQLYDLSFNLKKVTDAIAENTSTFKVADAKTLFEQAGVLFEGQVQKTFQQLVDFNKSVTEERRKYLKEEARDLQDRIAQLRSEVETLGAERSHSLAFLSATDSVKKYKAESSKLVDAKAEVQNLTHRREQIRKLQRLRERRKGIKDDLALLQASVIQDVDAKNAVESESTFNTIRGYFSDIVYQVIGHQALLTTSVNAKSHLEFGAHILGEDGALTSEADGHTYYKLLCVAFDLAVMRAHLGRGYPEFVYHDGVFESLDPRKSANLLDVMRTYSHIGVQQVITLLDSDTPPTDDATAPIDDSEIVVRLHDEGEEGRLFKMPKW